MPGTSVTAAAAANLAVAFAMLFLLLPGALTSEESEILIGDDEMQNDDLIVSKRETECPPDDEDDCVYDDINANKDALIFPISVSSTKKTRRPPTSTTPFPAKNLATTPGDDEEEQTDESSGSNDVTIDGSDAISVASTFDSSSSAVSGGQPSLPTPTSLNTIATLPDVEVPNQSTETKSTDAGDGGDRADNTVQDTGSPIQSPVPQATLISTSSNKDARSQLPPGVSEFWSKFPTTFNINIYLMIAIAAAFIVLIVILIIAVCKYTGSGNRHHHSHRRGGKGLPNSGAGNVGSGVVAGGTSALSQCPGNKTGYAYEACNTSPPPLPHHHVTNATPLVNATPTTNVHHPNYPSSASTPGHVMMMTPSSCPVGSHQQLPLVQTPMNDIAKPIVKKDVKEWYV